MREKEAEKQNLYLTGMITQHKQLMWTMFKPQNVEILQNTHPFEYQSSIFVDGTWHQSFIPLASRKPENLSNLEFNLHTEDGDFTINAVLRRNEKSRNNSEYLSKQTYTLNELEKLKYERLLNFFKDNNDVQIVSKEILVDMFLNYPFDYACRRNQIDLICRNTQTLF